MLNNRWMMEEELSFLLDHKSYVGSDALQTLQLIYERTQLDFFGIDFDVLPDGRLVIFELNPAMRHSFDHAKYFPYLRPHLQNITSAFNRMILRKIAFHDDCALAGAQ